jgi:hypothetical protein
MWLTWMELFVTSNSMPVSSSRSGLSFQKVLGVCSTALRQSAVFVKQFVACGAEHN